MTQATRKDFFKEEEKIVFEEKRERKKYTRIGQEREQLKARKDVFSCMEPKEQRGED